MLILDLEELPTNNNNHIGHPSPDLTLGLLGMAYINLG